MLWYEITAWLQASYPRDVLMPVKRGTKSPMYPHIDGQWTWGDFIHFTQINKSKLGDFDLAILLHDICVIDVDSSDLCQDLENRFPMLKQAPYEDTKKGRHYFFARSSTADKDEYMDQRSGVIEKVDFKTRCSTGNPGVILVSPSENKKWKRTPWSVGDILPTIPDDLLRAIARPMRPVSSATLTFPDQSVIKVLKNSHLRRFGLMDEIIGDSEDVVEIPLLLGESGLMEELLYICQYRTVSSWPPRYSIDDLQKFADYLCCSVSITRLLNIKNPASPLAWIYSIDAISHEWARDIINIGNDELVPLPSSITYVPLKKTNQWIYRDYPTAHKQGTELLRPPDLEKLPPLVRDILRLHPSLVLAGGAVLDMVCFPGVILTPPSDYDIYIVCEEQEEARVIIKRILETTKGGLKAQTGAALTICMEDIVIQIILRRYNSLEHVLRTFDLAPCQVLLHNDTIFVTPNWIHSIRHMSLWVNFHHWNQASVPRIFKYYNKGFEVFVPAMDRTRFWPNPEKQKTDGVVNLIVIEKGTWWGKVYVDKHGRPSSDFVKHVVRKYNFWGSKYQSGYSQHLDRDGVIAVVTAMIKSGLSWFGLRPVKPSCPQIQFDPETCMIPKAQPNSPFHSSSPNFPGLYRVF